MNNIVIINSPLLRHKSNLYNEDSLPPIGLGYIATSLENKGIKVDLIDCVAEQISVNELNKIITNKKPDFIATNIFTTNYELVKDFVLNIKFKTRIIIGGLATRAIYKDICNWETTNFIDIVFGDGEEIAYDIITNNLKEKPVYQTYGRRVFKIDKTSQYYVEDISSVKLNRRFFKNDLIKHNLGFYEATIITSRGCIYNCAFCASAISQNMDFGVRERTLSSVVDEIKYLSGLYKELNSIRILDDLFLKNTYSIKNAIEIFNHFQLNWRSMVHIKTFRNTDIQLLQNLRKSGCNELFIGIESGSTKILKQLHKTSNIELIINVLQNLFKAGIKVKGYFIYGFPNETINDFQKTYELAKYIKLESKKYNSIFRTSVFQYRPYHGTELYNQYIQRVNNELKTKENTHLSNLVGRMQFNFQSGNYSNESDETLHEFIYKTLNLNNL